MRTIIFYFVLLVSFSIYAETQMVPERQLCEGLVADFYPNFDDHPYLDENMQQRIRPHLIPFDHPAKHFLDSLFFQMNFLENEQTFDQAGFTKITKNTSCLVARHPCLEGYIFKMYLFPENERKRKLPTWEVLVARCEGAASIRKLIREEQIENFLVPDKWVYPVPFSFFQDLPPEQEKHFLIVVAQEIEIANAEESKEAWKTTITPKHLDEFYRIFTHGYGSTFLYENVPYAWKGKFAFIDTEYPVRIMDGQRIKKYLSDEMSEYWEMLIQKDCQP